MTRWGGLTSLGETSDQVALSSIRPCCLRKEGALPLTALQRGYMYSVGISLCTPFSGFSLFQ